MVDDALKGRLVRTVVWRRLDGQGTEHCRLWQLDDGYDLDGVVVLGHGGVPWRIEYRIRCTRRWQTCHATLDATTTDAAIERVRIKVDSKGRWRVNDQLRLDLGACVDVSFGFSPSTNTLPLRRLTLQDQQTVRFAAAWVKFPELTVEPVEQQYTRTGDHTYHHETAAHDLRADLTIDREGLIIRYPPLWEQAGVA
jgi:hypothetical protein